MLVPWSFVAMLLVAAALSAPMIVAAEPALPDFAVSHSAGP